MKMLKEIKINKYPIRNGYYCLGRHKFYHYQAIPKLFRPKYFHILAWIPSSTIVCSWAKYQSMQNPRPNSSRDNCPYGKMVEYKNKSLSSPHDCADRCPIDVIVGGRQSNSSIWTTCSFIFLSSNRRLWDLTAQFEQLVLLFFLNFDWRLWDLGY